MGKKSEKEYADRLLGKLFGFPQCCIDFWVDAPTEVLRRSKSKFPGLKVCPECEHKNLEEVVNDLATRRICPQPFPLHPTEADFLNLISDARFSPDEQMWLQSNKYRVIPESDRSDQLLSNYYKTRNRFSADCDAAIAKEPHWKNYFIADREFKIKEFQVTTLDALHELMRQRVIEQIKGGVLGNLIVLCRGSGLTKAPSFKRRSRTMSLSAKSGSGSAWPTSPVPHWKVGDGREEPRLRRRAAGASFGRLEKLRCSPTSAARSCSLSPRKTLVQAR